MKAVPPGSQHEPARHRGVPAALGAYILWGLAPIYFKLIQAAPPLEIIAHRILWSVPLLAGFLILRDGNAFWQRVRLPPRTVLILLLSGSLVALNWLIFVWAVVNGQVLATSPLCTGGACACSQGSCEKGSFCDGGICRVCADDER